MQQISMTNTWQQFTTTGTTKMIVTGNGGLLYLGTAAPAANGQAAFPLANNVPFYIDTAIWTHVWVRGTGQAVAT